MSRRAKHRAAEAASRARRLAEGLSGDPSNRTRRPRVSYPCPGCAGVEFADVFRFRNHVVFRHPDVSRDVFLRAVAQAHAVTS